MEPPGSAAGIHLLADDAEHRRDAVHVEQAEPRDGRPAGRTVGGRRPEDDRGPGGAHRADRPVRSGGARPHERRVHSGDTVRARGAAAGENRREDRRKADPRYTPFCHSQRPHISLH